MMIARRTLLAVYGAMTIFAGLVPGDVHAQEKWRGRLPRGTAAPLRPQPTPMLAVVGLREQRIRIYNSTGAHMLESPVSSGSDGYETPPGVFSIVQKELEHHSNLYDDASMPFMQRLTWTGIALHAGALPGYAASHGCVRLPNDFAEHIYDLTKVGMRVVVAREGIAPVAISEPSIFRRNVAVVRAEGMGSAKPAEDPTGRATSAAALEARVAALGNAADEAAQRTREKRAAATRAKAPVQPAERALRQAEAGLAKAETDLKTAEKVLADGGPGKRLAEAEALKASAPARIEAARAQREKMEADLKGKLDAARDAEQASAAAETAHAKALEAVEQAKQSMAPVSVFVSRKTQRIYVRKALQPLWEGPVLIRDADKPIGTFVFTANEAAEGSRKLRWSVLSLYKNPTLIEPPAPHAKAGKRAAPIELPITDAAAAEAALGRLVVPAEIADRISEVVLAGSSLIISDEPPNLETGKDTDFVVIMSGEPQGGIAIRQHAKPERSYAGEGDWGDRGRRVRRSSGGGGFGFWFD